MDRHVIESFSARTILVVGDLMLDRFVYGTIDRISPEAPIPVLRSQEERSMLGGAGNVARNIVTLSGKAILVGAVGTDDDGKYISESLCPEIGIDAITVSAEDRTTTVKTRFVCEGQQVLRVDREQIGLDSDSHTRLVYAAKNALARADVLVLSDYAKGVFTPTGTRAYIDAANAAGVLVIVDPKCRDLSVYRGADVITPNTQEAAAATGYDCSTDEGVGRAAQAILQLGAIRAVLITRGALGMTLLAPDAGVQSPLHIPTKASSVYDVSGAGDTVIATLALALSAGADITTAAHIANSAAQIVVSKLGTAAVSTEELLHSISDAEKLAFKTREQAGIQVAQWRRDGLKIGFANGCFDLVHPGHISLLRKAREECDRLVVGLNSDASVRRLKGDSRPIQDEASRAAVIGALRSVDLVTVFDEDTPLQLIEDLCPDVLFKGQDYQVHEVVGGDIIQQWGGRVSLIALEHGHSTTNIIARSEGTL